MSSSAPPAPPQSSAARSLRVTALKVGDSFSSTTTLRLAAERTLLAQGRTLVSDHRVTGGHQRMYRCSAAKMVKGQKGISGGCPVFVKANKRKDNQFYVTGCCFDHQNCAGGKKKPSLRALAEEGAVVVNANRKITAPAIVKTLKGTYGVELQPHTANRLKRGVLGVSQEAHREGYQRLESYLNQLAAGSPGTITDCKVCAGVVCLSVHRWCGLS